MSNIDKLFSQLSDDVDSNLIKEVESFKFSIIVTQDDLKRLDFLVNHFSAKRTSFCADVLMSAVSDFEEKLGLGDSLFAKIFNDDLSLKKDLSLNAIQLKWLQEIKMPYSDSSTLVFDGEVLKRVYKNGTEQIIPRSEDEEESKNV